MSDTTTKATAASGPWLDGALIAAAIGAVVAVVFAIGRDGYGATAAVSFACVAVAAAFALFAILRAALALFDARLDVPPPFDDSHRIRLEEEKALLLQGIKELEADAATGKVDADDYAHLRSTAETRALEIIRELDATRRRWIDRAAKLAGPPLVDAPEANAERRARLVSTSGPVAMIAPDGGARLLCCASCGAENPDDGRFCIGCGRPRAATAAQASESETPA